MNYGKSLCILCDKPLAGAALIAHPRDCPTHHFHCQCLVKHARQNRECPIDQIPFESVVCANGLPIAFAAKAPSSAKRKGAEGPAKSKEASLGNAHDPGAAKSDKAAAARNFGENTNTLPASCETRLSDTPPAPAATPAAENPTCAMCFKPMTGILASPDGCEHWFHENCVREHFQRHSVCPVKGCYREAKAFITTAGEHAQIVLNVEAEYRNMISAPPDFNCAACGKPDINLFRASARPCGHIGHRQCLIEFVRREKKCPVCLLPTNVIQCDVEGNLRFP